MATGHSTSAVTSSSSAPVAVPPRRRAVWQRLQPAREFAPTDRQNRPSPRPWFLEHGRIVRRTAKRHRSHRGQKPVTPGRAARLLTQYVARHHMVAMQHQSAMHGTNEVLYRRHARSACAWGSAIPRANGGPVPAAGWPPAVTRPRSPRKYNHSPLSVWTRSSASTVPAAAAAAKASAARVGRPSLVEREPCHRSGPPALFDCAVPASASVCSDSHHARPVDAGWRTIDELRMSAASPWL